jgi:hypothetical protein
MYYLSKVSHILSQMTKIRSKLISQKASHAQKYSPAYLLGFAE